MPIMLVNKNKYYIRYNYEVQIPILSKTFLCIVLSLSDIQFILKGFLDLFFLLLDSYKKNYGNRNHIRDVSEWWKFSSELVFSNIDLFCKKKTQNSL